MHQYIARLSDQINNNLIVIQLMLCKVDVAILLFLRYMMKFRLAAAVCLIWNSIACGNKSSQEALNGVWNYTKVENLNDSSLTLKDWEIAEKSPSISFSKDLKMEIVWGQKTLSHGTYKLEGDIIRITENLQKGKRDFPFIIRELEEDRLVFETMTGIVTRITAKKR